MTTTPRQKLIDEARRMLGGGLVRVELTPEHYEDALNYALETYRQRSANSVEERLAFLELQPNQTEYYLPDEIIEVRQVFRRGTGGTTSGVGAFFEPFGAAITNQTLLASGSSNQASLVTYELFTGFQELVGTMFGLHIMFTWHPTRHRLDIVRNIHSPEQVMLWVYNYRPEDLLLNDPYARPWLRRYTVAMCKIMLGEARSKFGSIAGPQGGTSLNGDAMKVEGQTEIDNLLLELANGVEQNIGYGFIIG
jgi:hypothetical protein